MHEFIEINIQMIKPFFYVQIIFDAIQGPSVFVTLILTNNVAVVGSLCPFSNRICR